MDAALDESTREALRTDWILDIDTTIKLLFGHQAGAEIGYNPTKPGRPSHTLHTYWIGNIRMVLDVEVQSGKACAAKHSLPRLRLVIERLAPEERPILVPALPVQTASDHRRQTADLTEMAGRRMGERGPGLRRRGEHT